MFTDAQVAELLAWLLHQGQLATWHQRVEEVRHPDRARYWQGEWNMADRAYKQVKGMGELSGRIENFTALDVHGQASLVIAADQAGTGDAMAITSKGTVRHSVELDRDDVRRLAEWCSRVVEEGDRE